MNQATGKLTPVLPPGRVVLQYAPGKRMDISSVPRERIYSIMRAAAGNDFTLYVQLLLSRAISRSAISVSSLPPKSKRFLRTHWYWETAVEAEFVHQPQLTKRFWKASCYYSSDENALRLNYHAQSAPSRSQYHSLPKRAALITALLGDYQVRYGYLGQNNTSEYNYIYRDRIAHSVEDFVWRLPRNFSSKHQRLLQKYYPNQDC